jgi:hypothetical protein
MYAPERLATLLFKKRLVDAARRTYPIVREFAERNALDFFIIDPFTNTANPFCQLASPPPHFVIAHVNNFPSFGLIDGERSRRASEHGEWDRFPAAKNRRHPLSRCAYNVFFFRLQGISTPAASQSLSWLTANDVLCRFAFHLRST